MELSRRELTFESRTERGCRVGETVKLVSFLQPGLHCSLPSRRKVLSLATFGGGFTKRVSFFLGPVLGQILRAGYLTKSLNPSPPPRRGNSEIWAGLLLGAVGSGDRRIQPPIRPPGYPDVKLCAIQRRVTTQRFVR